MGAFVNKSSIFFLLSICTLAFGGMQTYKVDHCVVTYENISLEYVKAICQTALTARKVAIERFGFDMPETIYINITCGEQEKTRLFTDGTDRMYLSVRSEKDLLKPGSSGIYHIYGMCHEVGHLAMYRVIRQHSWLTTAGAEGWAHYIGSRIVDDVYRIEKEKLWPDSYDYSSDGMKRLKSQLKETNVSDTVKGAGLWLKLAEIIGDDHLMSILKAWSNAGIDPADPAAALKQALLEVNDDPLVSSWWKHAEPLFITKLTKSNFKVRTVDQKELTGKTRILAHDDGKQNGKRSIAGSGHGVRFRVEGDNWYLTDVQVYGSRYGQAAPPKENFHIWICDADFNVIADFQQPYAKFKRSNPEWIDLPVTPTNVPSEFIICVGFNPTATKGVYVYYDSAAEENSLTGLPGKTINPFEKGDWMLRAKIDQCRTANSLSYPN